MFSKACKYAIKSLIYIASRSDEDRKIGLTEIADAIDSPMHFTAKIMQILAKQGIISSTKGPHGGFLLDKSPHDIYLIEVVKAIDGIVHINECGLGLKGCSDENPCPIHNQYKEIRSKINDLIHKQTIHQLAVDIKGGKTHLKNVL